MNYTPGDAENKYILAITKSYAALENYIQANYPEFEVCKMHYDRGMYGTSEQRRVRLYGTEVNVVTPLLQKPAV